MKKTTYSILAMAFVAALACGCTKENPQENTVTEVVLSANLPDNASKTAIDGTDNTKVNWSAGDKLSVWGGENNEFTLTGTAGTTSGTFSGAITSGEAQYALYPYDADATCADGVITLRVPNTQTAPEGSFDPAAAVMVGIISGSTITFKHAMAYLKITAPADVNGLLSITIESNDGTILTGDAKFATSNRTYSATGLGCNFVTVKPATGTFKAGAFYYAAIIPSRSGEISKGLTVRYLYKNDTTHKLMEKSKSNTNSLIVISGHVKTLGAADVSAIEATEKAVQLWADGPYWAKTNIGAKSASEAGQYFAWGYEEGCVRNSDNKGWVLASDNKTAKNFNTDCFPDRNASTFKDAAAANWGSDWSVPTYDDFVALIEKANLAFQLNGGDNSYIAAIGKDAYTDNVIDLYRAGKGVADGFLSGSEQYGYYMSATQSESSSSQSEEFYVEFVSGGAGHGIDHSAAKCYGVNIRPIYKLK